MDWGLMAKNNRGNTFLRARLLYKHKVGGSGYWNGVGVEEEAVFQQLAFIKDLCALLDLFGQ